jgi:hypothetical protein
MDKMKTIVNYKYISRLYILPNKDPGFVIDSILPLPNRWWRFWQWLLLGWEWEDIKEDES